MHSGGAHYWEIPNSIKVLPKFRSQIVVYVRNHFASLLTCTMFRSSLYYSNRGLKSVARKNAGELDNTSSRTRIGSVHPLLSLLPLFAVT